MKMLFFILVLATWAGYSSELVDYMRDNTVLVDSKKSQCTGILISRSNTTYILTVGHGVKHNINIKSGFIKGGRLETKIDIEPLKIFKTIFDTNDNVIEVTQVRADIIKYSSFESGYDLALLKIQKPNYSTNSVIFCLNEKWRVGDEVWLCGHFGGDKIGSYSITKGIIGYKNRSIYDNLQNQIDITIHTGASGGGLFLPNHEVIGILHMKQEEGMALAVRMEEIKKFCEQYDIEGILYPDKTISEVLKVE